MASRVAAALKKMREESRLTVEEMAQRVGKGKSTYAHYEDKFKGRYLPPWLMEKLLTIFPEFNIPKKRILTLGWTIETFNQADFTGKSERLSEPRHTTAMAKRGTLHYDDTDQPIIGLTIWPIEELDVRAGAGSGGTDTNQPVKIDGVLTDAVATVAEWRVPADLVRPVTNSPAHVLKIITIVGDSMMPDLTPGQKVMVDTGDKMPSPPGIFAVWDGLSVVVKQVEYIAHSEPARVLITSRNHDYKPYERGLDEAYIQGRVVGAWKWT